MTAIYYLDSGGNPYGAEHVDETLAEPMTMEHSDYWRRASVRGSKNEFVEELAPTAILEKHWPVEKPDIAFPTLRFKFKHAPFIVPDIMDGRKVPTVTAKAREVIERIDPDVHEFVPLTIVDGNGEPWTEQELFAFVCSRVVQLGDPLDPPSDRSLMPEAAQMPYNPGLAIVEQTPGLASRIAEFPFWSTKFDGGKVYWNETSMKALQDAELIGITVIGRPRRVGECINPIWFKELNEKQA